MNDLNKTLAKRRLQHGPFERHALIEIELRKVAEKYSPIFTPVQEIGFSMILHKIARILNGGHKQSDTWHDIAGYATIIEKEILDE